MTMNIELRPMKGKRLLCAVSGGADSMCLLHWLQEQGVDVIAAHYEHGIRGEESVRDMDFVRTYCESRSIPFVCARGDVPGYAAEKGMSIEEAARKLRYEFLEAQREALSCHLIATAHNLNDNAETVLFNLARGSGAAGMAGIPYRRGHIIRPLLNVSRAEIEAYLEENALPHVEDSSNASDDYTRNLIRHRIVPLMEGINPGFIRAAGRTAELCRRDGEYLDALAADFIREHSVRDFIPLAPFNALGFPVASRVLRRLVPGLHMDHVEDIMDFAAGSGYGELDVPGRRLTRDSGLLWLSEPPAPRLMERRLIPGESVELPELGMIINSEITEYSGEVHDLFKTSYIKYEIMYSDICVGPRRDGDRLRPAGRGCSKSLKSLFLEHRIPRHRRDAVPVIRDSEGVVLVHGIAMDERALPQVGEKVLKITFTKINSITGE